MLSNVGPEAGRAWCSVVRDTGVVEAIPFNSAERFECWWEGFQQRGCRLATPSPGEASVSRLDKSTPLPSRIDSDVSATRTSAWSCARHTTKMSISPISKFMLPISVRVGGRQKTALGNNRSGSPSQEKYQTGELPLSFHLPSHPSSLGSREDAFSLLNTDDKTRRAIRTQAGGGGVSDSARHHFKPPICRIRRNRTKLVSSCPVAQQRSKKAFSSPKQPGKQARIDSR